MKKNVRINNVSDFLFFGERSEEIRNRINCICFDREGVISQFSEPLFIKGSVAMLVLSGTCSVCVNYKTHDIEWDTIVLLSASHLFNFDRCSDDFTCIGLFVSKAFMTEMDSTDMIYKRIKYGVKLFNTPSVPLVYEDTRLLHARILAIDRAIDRSGHLYYKEVILNTLFAFYLDLSHIIDSRPDFQPEAHLTRYESIIKSFIELLAGHYRSEHRVEFYASQLNISAHYLTLIVKRVTGQSVSDFIFEMLYSEACTLLTHSKWSVQEISGYLNFADQSSFGKFFKRRAGVSPADYRKGNF